MPKDDMQLGSVNEVKVFACDRVITQPADIEYYHSCLKEFEAKNKLLGHVNDDGKYVIDEKLRRELALIPKEQTNEEFGIIESHALVLDKDLFFTLEIDEGREEYENNYIASLYLTEKVFDWENIDSIKTFIAKIVQPLSKNFTATAKKVFNIQLSLTDVDYSTYSNITKKIKKQNDDWKSLNEILDLSSQIYVMRMLQLLSQEGPLGQKVLDEYYQAMKNEGLDKGAKAGRYLALRKILDSTIEQFGGRERVFVNTAEQVNKIKQEYVEPIKQVELFRQKQEQKVVKAPAKQEEKKPEPQKNDKPAAKAGGKSAGKGDKKAKKDNKKKDKKGGDKPKKKEEKKGLQFGKTKVAGKEEGGKAPLGDGKIKSPIQNKPVTPAKPNKNTPQKPIINLQGEEQKQSDDEDEIELLFAKLTEEPIEEKTEGAAQKGQQEEKDVETVLILEEQTVTQVVTEEPIIPIDEPQA